MLIRLLHPTLFLDVQDMIDFRHRLNAVVFRRTQADACTANGEPLFSRRQVHTQAFHLNEAERRFYDAMMDYLRDGYDMAARTGKQGRALGFVMTIFQKIAASSFAAVEATLRRRLLSLTIHEAIDCDENLDPDGRDRAMNEARAQIREMHGLANDALGRAEVDRILADARVRLLRKLGEKMPAEQTGTEQDALGDEESAATLVSLALPAERRRIVELLELIPRGEESKTQELLRALRALWAVHPGEKIVIFTTYLGSVSALKDAIDQQFSDSGVEILKGGDHGAKLAAERRFKRSDGPRVLVCTAAGREGINLQFARVLFNHDLPWNPMDVEQRIGRIHRYGQEHTAQVYNLVSADTIEGRIYLLLEEKLLAIANALGKVDEYGQVAEDLREQILGQLSERLSYDKLYQEAVRDPTLRRTQQELEVALENARTAREVVFELFQDLEGFRLDDYRQFEDSGKGMERLFRYLRSSVAQVGGTCQPKGPAIYEVFLDGEEPLRLSTDRDTAKEDEGLSLLGLEHPLVRRFMADHRSLEAAERGLAGCLPKDSDARGAITVWRVEARGHSSQVHQRIVTICVNQDGDRSRPLERLSDHLHSLQPSDQLLFDESRRADLVRSVIPNMIRRELEYAGVLTEETSFSAKMLAWVEVL